MLSSKPRRKRTWRKRASAAGVAYSVPKFREAPRATTIEYADGFLEFPYFSTLSDKMLLVEVPIRALLCTAVSSIPYIALGVADVEIAFGSLWPRPDAVCGSWSFIASLSIFDNAANN